MRVLLIVAVVAASLMVAWTAVALALIVFGVVD